MVPGKQGSQKNSNSEHLGDNSPAILNKSQEKVNLSLWSCLIAPHCGSVALWGSPCPVQYKEAAQPGEHLPATLCWRNLFASLNTCVAHRNCGQNDYLCICTVLGGMNGPLESSGQAGWEGRKGSCCQEVMAEEEINPHLNIPSSPV